MLGKLFGWLNDPARHARQLDRDAVAVIDNAAATSSPEVLQALVDRLRERLSECSTLTATAPGARDRLALRYRALNREARKRQNMDESTVLTLAIIYLRAEDVGIAANGVCRRIEEAWQ